MPTWVAVTLATIAVAALLWIAGEQHYQSCVAGHNTAIVTGHFTAPVKGSNDPYDTSGPAGPGAVNGQISRGGGSCSRLPW